MNRVDPRRRASSSRRPASGCGSRIGTVAAAAAADGRTRPVRRELEERRRAGQALPPEARLLLQGLAGQTAAQPDRVVGVLDRQLRQRTRGAS